MHLNSDSKPIKQTNFTKSTFFAFISFISLLLCTKHDLNTNPFDPAYQGDYTIRAEWENLTSGDLEILRTYRIPFRKGRDEYPSLSPVAMVDTALLLSSYRSEDSLALRFLAPISGPLLIDVGSVDIKDASGILRKLF